MCSPLQITNKRLQTPQMCPSQADHKQLLTFTCSQTEGVNRGKNRQSIVYYTINYQIIALIRILLLFTKKTKFLCFTLISIYLRRFGSSKHCNPFRRPPVHFRSLRQDRRDLLSSLTGTLFHDPRKRTKRGKKHEYFNFAVQRD